MTTIDTNTDCARATEASRQMRGFEVLMSQLGDTMGPDLIVGHITGAVTQALLQEACYRVQQRYPLLRAAIRWPGGRRTQRPHIVSFAPDRNALDIQVVGAAEGAGAGADTAWQAVVERQTAHRFNLEQGFLFRVVWVPAADGDGGHLILCGHHALVDGTSLMRLLNQVMQEMAAVRAQMEDSGLAPSEAAAQLPPVRALPLSDSLYSYFKFGPLDRALTWIGRKFTVAEHRGFIRAPWLPVKRLDEAERARLHVSTQCVFDTGTPAQWEALNRQCREHGITVGGAFSAAVQFAVCRYLQEQGHPLPIRGGKVAIPLSMDYNMRERVDRGEIAGEAIGLGTSIASVGVKVPHDIEFWELADRVIRNARLQVTWRLPQLFQNVTDSIVDFTGFCRRHGIAHAAIGGVGDGVNISNVGRYPFATRLGSYAIRDVYGLNGACIGGPMFIFWLRHIDNHLCYNAIAASPAATRPALSTLFNYVVQLMAQLAANPGTQPLTLDSYMHGGWRRVPAALQPVATPAGTRSGPAMPVAAGAVPAIETVG